MKLSIIIVNYNVHYFLEQCLYSVRKASKNIPIEIIVVDNDSVDGSVEMIHNKFPDIQLIINKKNTGFSHANNQAIKISKGEYILLLNPDTVVEEDTFEKTLKFMDEHEGAAGLGVKMLDGKGNFLPESKRGLPTPMVAFYKIFGLSRLFPRSRIFNKYHLGHLDKDKIHQVEILSGAFMLLRKKALDKVGLLDEAFFMYGEDIDLSYRIILQGYKNYYFPDTRIIHYKGESTKKSSVNYVFVFYKAMIIFAKKHFSQNNAQLFSFLINIAIYLRAAMAIVSRFAKKTILPLLDSSFILIGLFLIQNYYGQNIRLINYSPQIIAIAFPCYTLVWLLSVFFSGGYNKQIKLIKLIRGVFIGTTIILVFYSLLPETYRFSRAIILFGSAWTISSIIAIRSIFHLFKIKGFTFNSNAQKRIIIVGENQECERVSSLLKQISINTSFIGFVETGDEKKTPNFIGNFDQLKQLIQIYAIDEVIFCAKNLSAQHIIDQMSQLGNGQVDYKIAPPESLSIIGSNSIETAGDLYIVDINSITKEVNQRNKRMLDVLISLIFLISSPLLFLFVKNKTGFITNIFMVSLGRKSWVGYSGMEFKTGINLPEIKTGVLTPLDAIDKNTNIKLIENRLNWMYAKDYKISNDLNIILKGYKQLGR